MTKVDKRTFKKPINTRGKLELMSTRFSPQVMQNEDSGQAIGFC